MKTEQKKISTTHKTGEGVENQALKITLVLNVPETLAEVIERVGEDGDGSAGELSTAMWRTRYVNTARSMLGTLAKESDPDENGIDDVEAFQDVATERISNILSADWTPKDKRTTSDPKEEYRSKFKTMTLDEQKAEIAALQAELNL